MKKVTIAIIAVIVLAVGAIFVVAQKSGKHGGDGFGRGAHRGSGMMLRGLDLTDEQKAQVKQIMEASKTKVQPVFEGLKANHQKLQDLTANGAFDEAQVTAVANEQAALSAQLIVERERTKSQVFALLTDAQKAKAAEMRDKMKERFNDHFKGGEKAPAGEGL
jgi:protein CpxP